MPIQIYKMLDSKSGNTPAIPIDLSQAKQANQSGHGIFWSVNEFRGSRRIENLVRLNSWALDMDDGSKEAMWYRIKAGLIPTLVVETKRGYQPYWKCKNGVPEHWNSIVLDRLIPFYGADKRARDISRIMRVPGFYHLKDPANPFLVTKVWEHKVAYTEAQMISFYPDRSAPERETFIKRQVKDEGGSKDLWEAVWRMDCLEALERLSGTDAVGGEYYSFQRNHSGTYNIISNQKSTSCWIDTEGRIGSLDKGGPTIFQWINWFHKNNRTTIEYMKKYFKELPWNK